MRAVATALQPSTVSHSRPPARARRAARCPARCTDATIAFPGRPAYVGGSSRAAGHFAARPAADGEAQRRYSTRRDGEPREPGESRSGSASVTNHADSGGSGRASGTAGSRAHTRRARARPRRQFPARSPHRIVEPAAGAGGVDGGLRGDECPQPLGLGAPTRQLVSLRWSHGGRDTPSAPAPLGRVDPRRTPAAVSGTGPAAQASATPPQPFLGERGAACRRPARRAMFPTVLHRSQSRVPRQVRDQLGVLPRDFPRCTCPASPAHAGALSNRCG